MPRIAVVESAVACEVEQNSGMFRPLHTTGSQKGIFQEISVISAIPREQEWKTESEKPPCSGRPGVKSPV